VEILAAGKSEQIFANFRSVAASEEGDLNRDRKRTRSKIGY